MSDNASTSSKRKRRRKEGKGDSDSAKSGGRTRKPGGIGRLFTVFLCCRSSATADDDAQPASRTTNQKPGSVPARIPTPVKEQSKPSQGVAGAAALREVATPVEMEITEKTEVVSAVPSKSIAAEAPSGPEKEVGEKVPEAKAADSIPDTPTTPTASVVPQAPLTVVIQSPIPTVSPNDRDIGALPEAPVPPSQTQAEETDMSDTDTIDDATVQPSGRSKEDVAARVVPPSTEKEDIEMGGASDGGADEHAATLAQSQPEKARQSWLLPPLQPGFEGKKCLVLDLDETLVHSSFKVSG